MYLGLVKVFDKAVHEGICPVCLSFKTIILYWEEVLQDDIVESVSIKIKINNYSIQMVYCHVWSIQFSDTKNNGVDQKTCKTRLVRNSRKWKTCDSSYMIKS